jgi:hypothetical protein
MIEACSLYILLFLGFVFVAWLVGKFPLLKKEGEESLIDSTAIFVLFSSLFGIYTYFIASWLHTTNL